MKQNTTILIVDDEAEGRTLLARLLSELGCNLAFASSGQEALHKATELIPDLILLDVMMPEMNGFQVCEHLRADPLLAGVPILMLTALNDPKYRLTGISVGADDFVSKPFDMVELKTRVQTILRLNRYRQLLAERAKFEWVVDQAEDGYLIIDKEDKLLYANPKARLYLGLSLDSDKTIGENFLDLMREKQYRCEPVNAWDTWPAPPTKQSPRYLVRPETSASYAFWLQVYMLNIPGGAEGGRVVRLKDITEKINLQREMHSFHAMISHKLRTPLVGILSGLELMLEYAAKTSNTDIVEVGQIAMRNVHRLRGQIDDIVEYLYIPGLIDFDSRFNLSQLPMIVTKLSANLDMESVIVSGHDKLDNTRILLSQRTLELVLWEILENCKKFHPQDAPSVEITVSDVDAEQVCLRVLDDGLHLSPEQLAQILTPYYQGDKYFTGEISGMGLGLSMVAMIMWGANGDCHIYNREDKPGLIVELTLPLAEDLDFSLLNNK